MTYPIKRERILKTFRTLVEFNTPSGQERDVADWLSAAMNQLGFEVTEDGAGRNIRSNLAEVDKAVHDDRPAGNLICRKKGTAEGPTLLFSSHMDTVVPNPNVKVIETDGVLHTDKNTILGADDKAGITAMLEAAHVLAESKMEHPDLEFIFTVSEETGLDGARQLDASELKAKAAFNMDSGGPPDEIIYAAPAETDFHIKIKGKAAHSGVNPEDGINAIVVAAHAISKLQVGRIDEETTVNIGIISGGCKTNMVPDSVEIIGEARSLSQDKLAEQLANIQSAFHRAADKFQAEVDIKELPMYEGYVMKASDEVVQLAQSACRKIGLSPKLAPRGGGSDANVYNQKGIPCVNVGVGAKDDHTVQEQVKIDHLLQAASLILGIIECSLQPQQEQQHEPEQEQHLAEAL
ncbi:MAG: hypothetical protein JWN30_1387 [Bacilli bacterium]|nr:hypothetical protein [Bacilli bacterium]